MTKPRTYSRFAITLRNLLKGSPYTYSQWAQIIGVDRKRLMGWTRDQNVKPPTSEHLRSILELCEESTNVSEQALREYKEMMSLPVNELGGEGQCFWVNLGSFTVSRSVGDYHVLVLLHAFLNLYDTLSWEEKERVLLVACDLVHYPQGPHVDRLWPGLTHNSAETLRGILATASKWNEDRQEGFVEEVREVFERRMAVITAPPT